jgi:hypothetical protein
LSIRFRLRLLQPLLDGAAAAALGSAAATSAMAVAAAMLRPWYLRDMWCPSLLGPAVNPYGGWVTARSDCIAIRFGCSHAERLAPPRRTVQTVGDLELSAVIQLRRLHESHLIASRRPHH